MKTRRKYHCEVAMRCRLTLVVCCLLFCKGFYAHGQAAPSDPLATAIDEVKTGNSAGVSGIVHEAGRVKAIPILKDLFLSSKDDETKEYIASTLMDLGASDEIHLDFLLQKANEAIDSDVPYPMFLSINGKGGPEFSPAFLAWAKSHKLSTDAPNEAGHQATQVLPGRLVLLGASHDSRAIPVLERGLKAHGLIQVMAAEALAALQNTDSIPLIVDACKNAPPEIASTIALFALVHFDDPRAQSAVGIYMSKEMLKAFEGKKLYLGPIPSREY
jgi:hypothetical protein